MFFLIDSDDGEVIKASETLEELKKDIDSELFYEDGVWIMQAKVVDGNLIIPFGDLVGNSMIYDLFQQYNDEQVKAW